MYDGAGLRPLLLAVPAKLALQRCVRGFTCCSGAPRMLVRTHHVASLNLVCWTHLRLHWLTVCCVQRTLTCWCCFSRSFLRCATLALHANATLSPHVPQVARHGGVVHRGAPLGAAAMDGMESANEMEALQALFEMGSRPTTSSQGGGGSRSMGVGARSPACASKARSLSSMRVQGTRYTRS